MKERPIIFSGKMVRAILAGTKTQTRRVIGLDQFERSQTPGYSWTWRNKRGLWEDVRDANLNKHCPYGMIGDRLWLRENWRTWEDPKTGVDGILFKADSGFVPIENTREAADRWMAVHQNCRRSNSWRPSIHLPRWASRISLDVLGVQTQRLQSISEADARAEGITPLDGVHRSQPLVGEICGRTHGTHPYTLAFAVLWDIINGDRIGCAWADNPWVWCVS